MTAGTGRTILLVVGLASLVAVPSAARAQGNTFNPYGNSGYADYREFGNPSFSNNPGLPGQSRLNGEPLVTRPRANSFQQYTQEMNDSDTGSVRRGSSSNLPYYQAYQQLNSRYNRVYRPNDTAANRKFEDRQRQRDANYAKALEERDPAKRAKLLREVEQGSLDRSPTAARPRTAPSPASGAPAPTTRPSPSASGSRAPSPYATVAPPPPGERRIPAPSPYSSATTRRTSPAPAPGTRAPAPSRTGPDSTSTPGPTPRPGRPPTPRRSPSRPLAEVRPAEIRNRPGLTSGSPLPITIPGTRPGLGTSARSPLRSRDSVV